MSQKRLDNVTLSTKHYKILPQTSFYNVTETSSHNIATTWADNPVEHETFW